MDTNPFLERSFCLPSTFSSLTPGLLDGILACVCRLETVSPHRGSFRDGRLPAYCPAFVWGLSPADFTFSAQMPLVTGMPMLVIVLEACCASIPRDGPHRHETDTSYAQVAPETLDPSLATIHHMVRTLLAAFQC